MSFDFVVESAPLFTILESFCDISILSTSLRFMSHSKSNPSGNSPRRVLMASLAGTTIEFFDFYIYATAAVLVFPKLFFPTSSPTAATLQSFATFGLAFFARPIGSVVFGHFGDRVGRKTTLVVALLLMGISTVMIGFLPTYAQIGIAAPILLAICRLGQGLGLGGEWGGAVLLATENAPPGKRAWYGMFPQLGAPIGFFASGATFLLLSATLDEEQFRSFGWRIPFVLSSALVFLGLYVRLKLSETPSFQKILEMEARVAVPMMRVVKDHTRSLILGTLLSVAAFVLFYMLTVFCLSWGTVPLEYSREEFLIFQLIGVLFFGIAIPLSAIAAERYGRRTTMLVAAAASTLFGLSFAAVFVPGHAALAITVQIVGFFFMGILYGPMGTQLAELFPAEVRYTGASVAFNLAGILGASVAPYLAMWLADSYGLWSVGGYLSIASVLSFIALLYTRETGGDAHH